MTSSTHRGGVTAEDTDLFADDVAFEIDRYPITWKPPPLERIE